MLRDMYRVARMNAPVQEIWVLPVADGAGAAAQFSVNFNTMTTAVQDGFGALQIGGEIVTVQIYKGDSITTVAANMVTAINAYYNSLTGARLPVTATSSAVSGVVTLTAIHAGLLINDLDIYALPLMAGNLCAPVTVSVASAGSGVPSLSTALALLGDDQWDFIVCPYSDSASIASYGALSNDLSGRWSYIRQAFGHVWTVASGSLAGLVTTGNGLNDKHLSVIGRSSVAATPAWLWPAGFAARVSSWLSDYATGNVSRNHTGLTPLGLQGARDRAQWLGYAARNSLDQYGISTYINNIDGSVSISKLVTTYRLGSSGQADETFRDVQRMYQMMHVVRIMKVDLLNRFGQKAISESNPNGLDAVVTPNDIFASLVNTYTALQMQGLVENVKGFITKLDVRRNASNPNRVDIFLPIQAIRPLDILAINATVYARQIA